MSEPTPQPTIPGTPPPATGGDVVALAPVAAPQPAAPPQNGLADWLFGSWVTGGTRPISRSQSFRYSVIAAIISAGCWAYASTIDNAPAWLSQYSPAATRISLSFAAAFLAGFVVRKILKAVFIAGVLLAGLFFAAKLADVKIDLSLIKSTTQDAVEGTRSLAQRLGEVTKHYLPSTFAATIGLWCGGRRDSIR